MRNNTIKSILIVVVMALLTWGCYKDKGNYIYSTINKITITADKDTFSVLQQDTLRINLSISQTMPDAAGLSYEWVMYPQISAPLTRRTIDTVQNAKAMISETPGTYVLDAFVKDKKTGVTYSKRFIVTVLGAYSEGWMVVEETGGQSDIGLITPQGIIFKDIYSKGNGGAKLPANVHRLSVVTTYRGDQKIYALSAEDMVQLDFVTFLKIGNFNNLFYSAPVPKPQEYYSQSTYERYFNNGKVYNLNLINPGPYTFGLAMEGNYDMAPFEIYATVPGFIYYDKLSQRFLRDAGGTTYLPYTGYDAAVDPFDMNNIGKRLIHAEANTGSTFNCLFKNNNNDSLFIYNLDLSKTKPMAAKYDVTGITDLLTASKFCMSRLLPYLYYVNGNKVYRLDILAKTTTLMYTFPAGASISAMKLYYNRKVPSDPNNYRMLVIASNETGGGKVYYFPLGATGTITGGTYSKVFTGFNKVTEITYKPLK